MRRLRKVARQGCLGGRPRQTPAPLSAPACRHEGLLPYERIKAEFKMFGICVNFVKNGRNETSVTRIKFLNMDLQTRKLHFIQEFLRLANDSIVEKFEEMLQQERKKIVEQEISPMTLTQYEHRIDKALDDLKNNRVATPKELKQEISSWK